MFVTVCLKHTALLALWSMLLACFGGFVENMLLLHVEWTVVLLFGFLCFFVFLQIYCVVHKVLILGLFEHLFGVRLLLIDNPFLFYH